MFLVVVALLLSLGFFYSLRSEADLVTEFGEIFFCIPLSSGFNTKESVPPTDQKTSMGFPPYLTANIARDNLPPASIVDRQAGASPLTNTAGIHNPPLLVECLLWCW